MHNCNTLLLISWCLYCLKSLSVGGGVGVRHVQASLEQVLGQTVNRVARLPLTNVQKSICQDRHQVVEQVLPNGLGLVIKHFLLLVAELGETLFCSGFFLLLQHLFNNFFLFVFVAELVLFESLLHEELHVAFLFSLLVESHEVERPLILQKTKWPLLKNFFLHVRCRF